MNHYLGQDVPEGANENCDLHEGFEDDGWWFEPTNYVLKEEDYTGRWIKALADNIQCTGVKAGEVIQIISKPNTYRLDKTSSGCIGMSIQCPLNTSEWELLEQPKDDIKLKFFPNSGAVLVLECDDLKEFKRYLFDSGRTCNEAVGNPKYLAWNETFFWYPSSTGKTNYKWIQLKHFIPASKVVPGYVKCVQALMHAKVGTVYPVVDEKHCLCEQGNTYEWDSQEFMNSTKQEYDAQISKDVSMIDIQKECKKRFPIGCTYKQNGSARKITLRKDDFTYSINGDKIYAHGGGGLLYNNGIYAITIPEEDCDNQDPLYICKQKYRKGMRVISACKTGTFSGEFIINVEPKEFRNLSGNKDLVDYSFSKGYLYYNGQYAEILEEGVYDVSKIIETNKPSVDDTKGIINYITGDTTLKESSPYFIEKTKKPSIESVQSVDVKLRTKKQINKFKF
jgi:hypothetical protein